MKAVVDELQIQDVEEPTITGGYVKIRTKAFGLNRAETYYCAGNYGEFTEPRIQGRNVSCYRMYL